MSSEQDHAKSDLDQYRGYLYVLAKAQIDQRLQAKIDASDLVQQTLLEAMCDWGDFWGHSADERGAWLRKILAHNLANAFRDMKRGKRDFRRERSIHAAIEHSSIQIASWLVADQSSPSQRAIRIELAVDLANALASLPEAQREALSLHHLNGWPLAQIAEQMQRTPAAISGLIKRGLATLRNHFQTG